MIETSILYFPWKSNPKLILSLSSYEAFNDGLSLYQPSSIKGKLTKYIFLFLYPLLKYSKTTLDNKTKEILTYLKDLNVQGIYISTDQQKYIALARCKDSNIKFVTKVSNTPVGKARIKRERYGYYVFKELKLTHFELFNSKIEESHSLLVYQHGKYEFNTQNTNFILQLISQLRKEKYFYGVEHPRIKKIINNVESNIKKSLYELIKDLVAASAKKYELCYEHGDLAPWNCYQINGEFGVFDFEYFESDGLQGFDLMRYAYSVAMLKTEKVADRINYLCVFFGSIGEYLDDLLIALFLCEEINRKAADKSHYSELEDYLCCVTQRLSKQMSSQ